MAESVRRTGSTGRWPGERGVDGERTDEKVCFSGFETGKKDKSKKQRVVVRNGKQRPENPRQLDE